VAFQRKRPAAIGAKAPIPRFGEPALATSIERVASGGRWLHEIKFDGYRVQVLLANDAVKSSRGADMIGPSASARSPTMHGTSALDRRSSTARSSCRPRTATTNLSVLQNELKGKSTKIVLVAFDLLYLNGYDLRKLGSTYNSARASRWTAGRCMPMLEGSACCVVKKCVQFDRR